MQADHLRRLLAGEPSMRCVPGTAEQAARAASLRAVVDRLARVERAALVVTAGDTVVRDGLQRVRMSFDSRARGGFPGTLLAPEGSERRPAVLVCGGRNGHLDQLTGEVPADHADRNVAEQLARSGFVTLAFDYGIGGGLEADRLGSRDEGAVLAHAFALAGRSLLGALVGDALGALAVLSAHPLVDPDRVGLFGHSLGGAIALHTALLAPRPLPLCTASHIGSYPALYGRLLTGHEGAALPGILEYADLPDLYAALAPAPLQLQYGTADPYVETADARAASALVGAAYAQAGPGAGAEAPAPYEAGKGAGAELLELPMGHGTHVGHAAEFFGRAFSGPAGSLAGVPAQRVHFGVTDRRTVLDRVDSALASGLLTQGPQVARFEELSRIWTGTHGAAVSSGAAALEIALRILDVAGRTVLVPVNTFFATAAAAVRAGAAVRFVDVELDGLGIDPDALRTALDRYPDTAAVLPVHIGGIVSPGVDGLLDLCAARGIAVVEDAAHAFGSTLGGRPAGSIGQFGAFSFFPTKVVTSAEGGLLTSAESDHLEQIRRWRDHGKSAQGSSLHDRPGGNWRLSEVHAAVGTVELERFAETLEARRTAASRYGALLDGLPGIRAHPIPAAAASNFYKYLVYPDRLVDRVLLKKRLRERHGVSLAGEVYDQLLCDHPYFADRQEPSADGEPYPRGRWFARHHLALPLYPSITEAEQIRVISALRRELS